MNDNILFWVEKHIKLWSKPATPVLISGLFTDLARSRTDLILENARCASNSSFWIKPHLSPFPISII